MINTIKALFTIDDKGSLKKTADKADRASGSMNRLGRSAGEADRRLKGTGQQSSNSTKNFSKMAQGVDGFLVPAYATLAAQLFAVSAAFQFLKQAGDLKTLQAGQLAYTSATGVAMKSLTKDIIAATGAQVNFTDASQAAAIGTAAGLSTDQLTRLGKAAKDSSAVLGRDVTDSFNRLVRGVTKAEPELLDELGIILRLKDASKEYADALGVNENALTTYQKSQAVVNNVLSQTEAKYSRILEITGGGQANQFAQLGKAFNDVLMEIQQVVAAIAGPLARVLTETPALAFAAFGLLLSGPLSAVGISFKDMAKEATHSARVQKRAANIAAIAMKKKTMSIEDATAAFKKQAVVAAQTKGIDASPTLRSATQGPMTSQARANLKKALVSAEAQYAKHGKIARGIFKKMDIEIVRDYKAAMLQMEAAEKAKVTKTQIATARMKAAYLGVSATIKTIGATAMRVGTRLLSFLGWVGIAYTIFELFRDLTGWFEKAPDPLQKTKDKLKDLADEYKDFLKVQKELLSGGGLKISGAEGYGNVAKFIQALGNNDSLKEVVGLASEATAQMEKQIAFQTKLNEAYKEDLRTTGKNAAMVRTDSEIKEKAFNDLSDAQQNAVVLFNRQIEAIEQVKNETGMASEVFDNYIAALKKGDLSEILNARDAVVELGTLISQMQNLQKASEESTSAFFKSFAPLSQADQSIKALNAEIKNLESKALNEILNEAQLKRLEKAKSLVATITAISEAERRIEREKVALQNKKYGVQRNLSNLQREYTDNLFKQREADLQIQTLEQQRLNILRGAKESGEALTSAQIHQLSLIQLQLDAENNKKAALQDQLDLLHQMGSAAKNAFEGGVTAALKDLITGKESSFKDSVAKIAEATLTSVADTLAKHMSKGITDFLFGSPEADMKAAIVTAHAEGAAIVADSILAAYNGEKVAPSTAGQAIANAKSSPLGFFSKAKNYLFGTTKGSAKTTDLVGATGNTIANPENSAIQTGVFSQFTSDLKSLFDGDAPFLSGLAKVFSSGLQGFDTILGDLARGLFGNEGLFASETGFFSSLFSAAAGARYGGVLEGYSTGGIARGSQAGYPAILHGTEAVVPLPHGNAIPVEMRGAGNGTNNVVVNVNVDNQGNATTTTESQSSQDAGKLGQMISQAVQKELQNQKRSGGILNPYGAS